MGGAADFEDEFEAGDEELDLLWETVREQLTDAAPTGDKFARNITDPQEKSIRLRFTRACERADKAGVGYIKLRELQAAFTSARVTPALSLEQCEKLVIALEAWHRLEQRTVQYKKFLDGRRGVVSKYGVFPKHKKSSTLGGTDAERRKRMEDEAAAKKKEEAERLRKQEELERKMAKEGMGKGDKKLSKEE